MDQIYDLLENVGVDIADDDCQPELDDELPSTDELEELPEEELVDPKALVDSFAADDPVRMYLNEIGKVALLTAEQEVELGKVMATGTAAREQLEQLEKLGETIPAEVQEALDRAVRGGEKAKQQLIEANLRLVVSIAKRHVGQGMALLDLIQEGNLGLIKAVERFDHTRGYKFSTYATWWIRQAITRGLADNGRTVRLPVYVVDTINKINRVKRQLMQTLGNEPTLEEIAAEMEMPVEKVRESLKVSQEPVSLDATIGEDEDSYLGDFVPDETARDPEEAATIAALREQMLDVLSTLPSREEKVIKLRFGLEDGRSRTLEEVGREFNVTRERIRQIEADAMRRLRHPRKSGKLEGFLR